VTRSPRQPPLHGGRVALRSRGGTLALLALPLLLQACGRPASVDTEESAPPFSFRSLDLQQRTNEGLPAWTLKSPEARYNIRSGVARALRPEGVIFAKGQPLYRLGAMTGTVVNDGAAILLEGSIRLRRLGRNPLVVQAERALWIPGESLMRFELSPSVRDERNRLSSKTALLRLDRDLLELRGAPRLERWRRSLPLNARPEAGQLEMVGTVKSVDWQPGKGTLVGEGPVTIRRRPPGRSPKEAPQVVTASRLEGNTLQQRYTLKGPVAMNDPVETSWFRGGTLTVDAKEQWLTSAAPFQGQRGRLRVQGEELRLDGAATTATIARACQLEQAGDAVLAQRCQWNWASQAVQAEGDVRFQRSANQQLTRAERITGRLGAGGSVTATTPGGRVITQVRVPRQAKEPSRPRVPAKPAPIVF
jgi:hypothetical protein